MSAPLPLAAAAERLRGKPGRPPLTPEERAERAERRQAAHAARLAALAPRLFDVPAAARYLGVSPWTVRTLEAAGQLARVHIAALRKLLFDREDLDRLIATSKDAAR
jgi:hypothetical protein